MQMATLDWLQVLKRASMLASDIEGDISGRHRVTQGEPTSAARKDAEIRTKIMQLQSQLNTLQNELESMESNPRKYGVMPGELSRRRDLLANLSKTAKDFAERAGRISNMEGRKELLGGPAARRTPASENDETRSLDTAQILQLQRDKMTLQDRDIEALHSQITTIKQISYNIGDELTLHKGLLEDIDHHVDKTSNKIVVENKRTKWLLGQTKSNSLCCCACLLVMVLVILLYFLLGR
eukprot:gnl/Hemi2/16249_TR5402_c0_g1_i1.p1 gnl/Hemi2/16249_TR5402_c0_g1~~gnl/Hemi2/16249_TR5402_c0_g1_i1.p1  ORF type:complete len:238 (+),score=66.77 gnl/Hemi2/16249_TR5402_c0_g1_i1:108-821(+)